MYSYAISIWSFLYTYMTFVLTLYLLLAHFGNINSPLVTDLTALSDPWGTLHGHLSAMTRQDNIN